MFIRRSVGNSVLNSPINNLGSGTLIPERVVVKIDIIWRYAIVRASKTGRAFGVDH